MSDELKAAAERVLMARDRKGYITYSDAFKLAEARLAENDATPIDETWLREAGFTFPAKLPGCEQHCYAPLTSGSPTSRLHIGLRKDGVAFAYVSAVDLPHIKTRGDVRRLCRALGIELKEKP